MMSDGNYYFAFETTILLYYCSSMRLQGIGSMSATAAKLYQEGHERMQSYCHSSACRHARVVNFFAPGTLLDGQSCT